MTATILYDHFASGLSDLDQRMIKAVPPGGNWTNIPLSIPSKRLDQIREMARQRGGVVRTTYYGRLRPDKPSYTISTYFNRPGNGCNIHPSQDRTLTIREAARLQSFPDCQKFLGSDAARRKQVGNAVPVLLARAVGSVFPPGQVIDLFSGAGGLSLGLTLAGHNVAVATDIDELCLKVHASQHTGCRHILGNVNETSVQEEVVSTLKRPDLLVGGPPCQGWSYGGWHKHNDPRNALVWTFIRMLDRLRPRAFIMENVQGLLWMAEGKALITIKAEMEKVGYRVTHFVLNAAHYGVPQQRIRVFVVGVDKGPLPLPPDPLFSADDCFLPPPITVEEALGDLPPVKAGERMEEIPWVFPKDGVPYRDWSRGLMDFSKMYHRIIEENRRKIGSHSQVPSSVASSTGKHTEGKWSGVHS